MNTTWKAVVALLAVAVFILLSLYLANLYREWTDSDDLHRKALERAGYSTEVIHRVLANEELDLETFTQLANEDPGIRFIVARNPALPPHILSRFLEDQNDVVRAGAAGSPNLTPEQIQKLFDDESEITRHYLAMNPYVPEPVLVRLHEENRASLAALASNPRCPETLKEKIRSGDDQAAKYWLEKRESEAAQRRGRR